MRVGRLAAAWVCALAAAVGCADTSGPASPEVTGIVAPEALELTGDLVPIPAEAAGDLVLARLDPAPERRTGGWPPANVVVTSFQDEVLQLSTVDLTDPDRAGAGFEWLGEPGPSLTDGRPTRWVYGPGFDVDRGLAFQLSAEQAVFAGGRTVEDKVLVAALDALNEIPTASTSPGSVIGVIPGFESTRVSAAYDGDRRGVYVTIEAASPSVQASYRAVAHPDPERTVDPMTESSCCARTIMNAAREVDLGPRQGWLATLTPYQRILIIDGDPGVVMTTAHNWAVADDDLLEIGASILAGSEREREDLQQMLLSRQRDERAAEVVAQEEGLGWTVLERVDFDEDVVILSTGTSDRPWHEGDATPPTLCAVMHHEGAEACTGRPPPDELTVALGIDVVLVVAPGRAATVTLEGKGEVVDLTAVRLDAVADLPSQVFVGPVRYSLTTVFGDDPRDAVVVARDASGTEIGRTPLFR